MKVTVIGTGYVGLVTGACLADVGNDVLCLDVDKEKISTLERGELPFYEPGLRELVASNVKARRLAFTTDPAAAARHGQIQFIAVGTPADEDGSADLQYVLAAARAIGAHMDGFRVVVNKSTVPVGTAERVRATLAAALRERGVEFSFAVVSNPEFLKEGSAIDDFMRPDRIIVGSDDKQAIELMRKLYAPFERNHSKLMVMDIKSAELTKYAANAMLATRISFMNELALLAESVGADIEEIRRGIGSDPRIGTHFLYAGCGYGGSCFPKDVKALIQTGRETGHVLRILRAVEKTNEAQKRVLPRKIVGRFGEKLTGKKFAIWGLAFKPNTDDMRAAPSLAIIDELLRRGAAVSAYDPIATSVARKMLGIRADLQFCDAATQALEGADALVIVTEWKEFRSLDLDKMRASLRTPVIFDGRNILDPALAKAAGFEYYGIGRA
jgi:UDPglucose 6-dehydrogenase